MEDFTSKIQIRFKKNIIAEYPNLNYLNFERKVKNLENKFCLLPGMEIWQILFFKNNSIKEIKLTTILKIKNEK
jgi:hypothetical protein